MKTTVLLAVGGAQRAAFDGWWGAKPEERRELAGDAWGLGLKVGEGGGGRGGRCPWPETHGRKPMAGNPWVGAHGREHMAGNSWPETHGEGGGEGGGEGDAWWGGEAGGEGGAGW